MNINMISIMVALITAVSISCYAGWNEYSADEPLVPERLPKERFGKDKFLARMNDGSTLCLYTDLGFKRDRYSVLRLKRPDGTVVECKIDEDEIPEDKVEWKEWLEE